MQEQSTAPRASLPWSPSDEDVPFASPEHGSRKPRRKRGGKRGQAKAAKQAAAGAPAAAEGAAGRNARGRSRGHGKDGAAERPTAPKNSSSYLMRSKALGLSAPLVSPPTSTPHARWPSGATPALAELVGGEAQLGTGGLDVWGSNLDRIRRVDGGAQAGSAAEEASGGVAAAGCCDAQEVPREAPGMATEAVNGFVLGQERSAEHFARLETENLALRQRLAVAERQLAQLRAACAPAEASAVAPRAAAGATDGEATSAGAAAAPREMQG